MMTLQHAFNAKDIDSLVRKIIREQVDSIWIRLIVILNFPLQTPQLSKGYSKPLGDILSSMLKKDPKDRPTAKAILQHSYIKQHILRLLDKAQAK